jgi:uncharacterized protein (DUF1684 family)
MGCTHTTVGDQDLRKRTTVAGRLATHGLDRVHWRAWGTWRTREHMRQTGRVQARSRRRVGHRERDPLSEFSGEQASIESSWMDKEQEV